MQGTFIFVLDRGFVVIGDACISEDLAFHWDLLLSATIRKWGTTQGLAELKDGPLPATVLDKACRRTIPFRSVLDIIHVSEKGAQLWQQKLSSL